jgi:hypothetical protein
MTRALVWLVLGVSAALCLWEGHRYYTARSDAGLALRQLAVVRADAREIAALQAAAPPESRRPRPATGLATRVTDILSKAGLPQAVLQNVSPETETGIGNSGLRRQSAKITLDGLTLPDLGRFLQQWRATQPPWVVASIDITPTTARIAAKPGQATDRPLRAVLGVEIVFAANEGVR